MSPSNSQPITQHVASVSADTGSEYSGTELDVLAGAVNYHRWIMSKFQPYIGDTIGEVGAGMGSVSKLLLDMPVKQLIAFEPSHNMFPYLTEELRNEPRAQAINDFFDPRYTPEGVDTMVYINVLEHIEDHRGELERAFAALRSHGHVLIFVPALTWLYSEFDKHVGHFRRYTKRSLIDVAEGVGFKIKKAQYFDVVGIAPWYLSFVLLKGHPRSGNVALYDKLVVPPMRFLENIVTPPIGKNVLLVGEKC